MFKEMFFVVGGACIGIALGRYLYKKYNYSENANRKLDIENLCDDECIVNNLGPSTLTEWFKTNNPDDIFQNVVILPTEKNIEEYQISRFVKEIPQNSLFQVIYDDKIDSIQRFRLVNFGTIQEHLNEILEEAGGVLIIEERG